MHAHVLSNNREQCLTKILVNSSYTAYWPDIITMVNVHTKGSEPEWSNIKKLKVYTLIFMDPY